MLRSVRATALATVVAFGLAAAAASAAQAAGGPVWDVKGAVLESGAEKSTTSTAVGSFKLKTAFATVECTGESNSGKLFGGNPGTDEAAITFTGCHLEGHPECKANGGEVKTEVYTVLAYPKGATETEAKAYDAFFSKASSNVFVTIKLEGSGCGLFGGQSVATDASGTEVELPHFATKRKCGLLAEVGQISNGAFAPAKAGQLSLDGGLNFPTTKIAEAEYWTGTGFATIKCALSAGALGSATQSGITEVRLSPEEEFGWAV